MRINNRLDQLEKEVTKVKYKFQYDAVVIQDKDGVKWFTSGKGKKISEHEADPDLIPKVCVILPECMRI